MPAPLNGFEVNVSILMGIHKGHTTVKALEDFVLVSQSSIRRAIKNLRLDGYVEAESFALTDLGRHIVQPLVREEEFDQFCLGEESP